MLNNEWQIAQFPLAPGHEAIGTAGVIDSCSKEQLAHAAGRARHRIVLPNDL
jgi:hypothetical protein